MSRHLYHRLGDDRVDLARHNAAARLHFRHIDFPQPGPGPAGQKADVVSDFVQTDGHGFELPAGLNDAVQGGLRLEMVVRFANVHPGHRGETGAGARRKLRVRIHPRTDRRAAQRHFGQRFLRPPHAGYAVRRLPGVAAELLPQTHRRGILQVGAPRFDDGPEIVRLAL